MAIPKKIKRAFPYLVSIVAALGFSLWWAQPQTFFKPKQGENLVIDGTPYFEIFGNRFRDTNWKELVLFDYDSGSRPEFFSQIEGQRVRIPGFIVPLTDEIAVLDEFLFVPNDQACIHVPAPPPNLIIRAKLKEKMPMKNVFNPSWILGKLEIVPTQSEYGSSAFQIQDAQLIEYEEETK